MLRADPANVEWGSAPTDALTRSIFQFCPALGDATISAKARVFVHSLYPPLPTSLPPSPGSGGRVCAAAVRPGVLRGGSRSFRRWGPSRPR